MKNNIRTQWLALLVFVLGALNIYLTFIVLLGYLYGAAAAAPEAVKFLAVIYVSLPFAYGYSLGIRKDNEIKGAE